MDKRKIKKDIEYLVKWKNYDDPADYTWEFASSLQGAEEIVKKFEQNIALLYDQANDN